MPIQTPGTPSEGIQPILRKILLNQQELFNAISGNPTPGKTNLTQVGGTPVSSPLPVAIDLGGETFPIAFGDSPSIDAFDRLRVSDPTGLFESTLTYDSQPLLWSEEVTASASSTHLPNESAVQMSVSASGAHVYRQTRDYFRYQPGKSQLILLTFALGTGNANVRKRMGYFEARNGIFLEEINGAVWMVRRTYVSGAVVEERVAQADWNIDTFAGLDITKAQILIIDLEWLGVGRVRTGFVIDGIIRYVHEFVHANILSTVYMSTAQLPLRLSIEATGNPGGTVSMKVICGAVISEGGQDQNIGFPFAATSTALKAIPTVGVRTPILSIRPKATFNSIVNRVQIIQREVAGYNDSGLIAIDVVYNGTLTGASFASVDTSSVLESDVAATAISGGILVLSFMLAATNQSKSALQTAVTGRLPISLDLNGANPTPLTLCGRRVGAAGSAIGSIAWQEYR